MDATVAELGMADSGACFLPSPGHAGLSPPDCEANAENRVIDFRDFFGQDCLEIWQLTLPNFVKIVNNIGPLLHLPGMLHVQTPEFDRKISKLII